MSFGGLAIGSRRAMIKIRLAVWETDRHCRAATSQSRSMMGTGTQQDKFVLGSGPRRGRPPRGRRASGVFISGRVYQN